MEIEEDRFEKKGLNGGEEKSGRKEHLKEGIFAMRRGLEGLWEAGKQ